MACVTLKRHMAEPDKRRLDLNSLELALRYCELIQCLRAVQVL